MTRPDGTPPVARVAGHFGEFLQGRIGSNGPVALVTLPCPMAQAHVWRVLQAGQTLVPSLIDKSTLTRLASVLGQPLNGGYRAATSMPLGAGCGMSTALLIALVRTAGLSVPRSHLARALVCAEGASDPLMMAHPARHLWASRRGRSLHALPPAPRFEVVGGLWGPVQATDARDLCFADIQDLVASWQAACAASDAPRAAQLARDSALRHAEIRRISDDPTDDLARDLGALGWATAHTGSARALLFRPGQAPGQATQALAEAGYTHVLRFEVPR